MSRGLGGLDESDVQGLLVGRKVVMNQQEDDLKHPCFQTLTWPPLMIRLERHMIGLDLHTSAVRSLTAHPRWKAFPFTWNNFTSVGQGVDKGFGAMQTPSGPHWPAGISATRVQSERLNGFSPRLPHPAALRGESGISVLRTSWSSMFFRLPFSSSVV